MNPITKLMLKNLLLMVLIGAAIVAVFLSPLYLHRALSWLVEGLFGVAVLLFGAYQGARLELGANQRKGDGA